MKTYADALASQHLANRLLATSCHGTIALWLLFITGIDKTFASKISNFSGLDINVSYSLIYFFGSLFMLAINSYFTLLEIKNCALDKNDWCRARDFVFQDRSVYNFTTKRMEITKIPKALFVFFGGVTLFALCGATDILILSPLKHLFTESGREYIFRFDSMVFYSLFLFSICPPYIFILIAILWSRLIYKIKQHVR